MSQPVTAAAVRAEGVDPEKAERVADAASEAQRQERSPLNALVALLPKPDEHCQRAAETTGSHWDPVARRRRELDRIRDTAPMHLLGHQLSQETLAQLGRWVPHSGIILLGETGDGKSAAAVHLLERLLGWGERTDRNHRRACSTMWARADQLIQAGGRDDAESAQFIERASRVKVLFLDDVARVTSTLSTLVQLRADRKAPTVVTSGARSEDDFCKRTGGEAFLRWLIDAGRGQGYVVNMWGERRRRG